MKALKSKEKKSAYFNYQDPAAATMSLTNNDE